MKNFNEFLSFAAMNRSRISDRLNNKRIASSLDSTGSTVTITTGSSFTVDDDSTETLEYDELKPKPLIKLTKSSFDDSDSSSIGVADSFTAVSRSSENSSFIVDDSSVSVSPVHQPLQEEIDVVKEDEEENGSNQFQLQIQDGSSPDDSQEYFPMTTSMTRELRLELENLDRHVFGTDFHNQQRFYTLGGCIELDTPPESVDSIKTFAQAQPISYRKLNQNGSGDALEMQSLDEICALKEVPSIDVVRYREKKRPKSDIDIDSKRVSSSSANADVFVWENPLHQVESPLSTGGGELSQVRPLTTMIERTATTPDEYPELEYDGEIIVETGMGKKSVTPIRLVRRTGDQSNCNSNRNSMILPESDSDDSPDRSPAVNFRFHPNNPFYEANCTEPMRIQTTSSPPEGTLHIPQTTNMAGSSNSFEEAAEASKIDLAIQQPSVNVPTSATGLDGVESIKVAGVLPPPHEFGGGNPFLMFLCLTILLQHRDYIIKTGMDYNEMAMHFDKMVRKHNVVRVLNQARQMYAEYRKLYLQEQQQHQQLQQQRASAGSASMSSSMYGNLGGGGAANLIGTMSGTAHPRRNTTSGVTFTT